MGVHPFRGLGNLVAPRKQLVMAHHHGLEVLLLAVLDHHSSPSSLTIVQVCGNRIQSRVNRIGIIDAGIQAHDLPSCASESEKA